MKLDLYSWIQVVSSVVSMVVLVFGWVVWFRKEFGYRTIPIKGLGTIKVKRKWDSLQLITPIVDNLYMFNGKVPNEIREELAKATGQVGVIVSNESKEVNTQSATLFINLSNHPFNQEKDAVQIAKAKELFGVDDSSMIYMEFPSIEPEWTTGEIDALAKEYEKKILLLSNTKGNQPKHLVVHLMGEMNFTFRLVSLLQKSHVRCVASTSYRDPFKFVTFRDYNA